MTTPSQALRRTPVLYRPGHRRITRAVRRVLCICS
jgi:hypothetical protein